MGELQSLGRFLESIRVEAEKRGEEKARHTLPYQPMVLVFEPQLGNSRWQDCVLEDCKTKIDMVHELKEGTKRGDWLAWRLVYVGAEEMGVVE